MELISWLYVCILVLAAIVLMVILDYVLKMKRNWEKIIYEHGKFMGQLEAEKEALNFILKEPKKGECANCYIEGKIKDNFCYEKFVKKCSLLTKEQAQKLKKKKNNEK